MIIQLNTDNNLTIHKAYSAKLDTMLSEKLSRFSAQITRLEVHLTDENGKKNAVDDKRCMIEARLEGMKPIAVTSHANNYDHAVEGAVDKLMTTLDTRLGRLSNH